MTAANLRSPLALGERGLFFEELPGLDGTRCSVESFAGSPALALVFVGTGCPTVRYYRERLAGIQAVHAAAGLQIVAVNANNPSLSSIDDLPEIQRKYAEQPWPFPYLRDREGVLARQCGAICTPHAFLFDADRRLRYRGRIDDSRTGRRVTRDDLSEAAADVLSGRPVRTPETEPFGCAIVW